MKGTNIQDKLTNIDDKYILESHPDNVRRENLAGGLITAKRKHQGFWNNGAVAAILSVAISLVIIGGVIVAEQMGLWNSTNQPGSQPDDVVDGRPYNLIYTSNGDGTCRVKIVTNDKNTTPFDVVIPEKSPDGDTVIELEDSFTMPYELPHVMTVEDFERYILAPMEDYFGVTLEMAEEICHQYDHPLFAQSFYLRQRLSFFIHYTTENSDEFLENDYRPLLEKAELYVLTATMPAYDAPAKTPLYTARPPFDHLESQAHERHELFNLLLDTGFTAENHETINAHLLALGEESGTKKYAPANINYSSYIRSIQIPPTITLIYENAFNGWSHLSEIIYDGTQDQWNTLTEGHEWMWFMELDIQCTDGTLSIMAQELVVEEPIPRPELEKPVFEPSDYIPRYANGYYLLFESNGDGTCRVQILTDPTYSNQSKIDIVIPEKSPAGDRVVALENSFADDHHIPSIILAEDFEAFIRLPLEAFFGITTEDANAILETNNATSSLYSNAVNLRKWLDRFTLRSTEGLSDAEKAELTRALPVTATTDVYVMEPHTSESEQLLLYMILHATGVVPMDFEMMDIHYRKQIGSYDHREYASAYNSSLLIRSITLPSTLISTYEGVFHGWRSLTDITYDGTKAEFEAMFGDRLDRFDDDYNTMIANSRLGGFGIDGEGLDFYGQYLVVVHFSDGTQAIY